MSIDAIMAIKVQYQLKRNWMGDPCAPSIYAWDGLNCSYSDIDPPRITALNLSSSGLTEVSASIANLKAIVYLKWGTDFKVESDNVATGASIMILGTLLPNKDGSKQSEKSVLTEEHGMPCSNPEPVDDSSNNIQNNCANRRKLAEPVVVHKDRGGGFMIRIRLPTHENMKSCITERNVEPAGAEKTRTDTKFSHEELLSSFFDVMLITENLLA